MRVFFWFFWVGGNSLRVGMERLQREEKRCCFEGDGRRGVFCMISQLEMDLIFIQTYLRRLWIPISHFMIVVFCEVFFFFF